jgi:hypothetical protein
MELLEGGIDKMKWIVPSMNAIKANPINMGFFTSFKKAPNDKYIIFYFSDGGSIDWMFSSKEDRDQEYERIIKIISE